MSSRAAFGHRGQHDSRDTPTRQARRARTLPTGKEHARPCPSLPSTAQLCPLRPGALPVLRRRRDTFLTPVLERSTEPCLSGVRAGSNVKQGDSRCLLGIAWICRRLLERAQCPTAPRLGTVGGMIHDTRNTRQARRARTLPARRGRARPCPSLPNAGEPSPARPGAWPVLGGTRDTVAHEVRHGGSPRYVGRAEVDSTRSAACPFLSPDALGPLPRFEWCGSSGLTAWRRTCWRQARSVGHSAAGSLPPMQGPHTAQAPQRVQKGEQP